MIPLSDSEQVMYDIIRENEEGLSITELAIQYKEKVNSNKDKIPVSFVSQVVHKLELRRLVIVDRSRKKHIVKKFDYVDDPYIRENFVPIEDYNLLKLELFKLTGIIGLAGVNNFSGELVRDVVSDNTSSFIFNLLEENKDTLDKIVDEYWKSRIKENIHSRN